MTGQILFKFKFDHTNRVNSLQGEDRWEEEVKNDIIDHTKDSSHEELRKKKN